MLIIVETSVKKSGGGTQQTEITEKQSHMTNWCFNYKNTVWSTLETLQLTRAVSKD